MRSNPARNRASILLRAVVIASIGRLSAGVANAFDDPEGRFSIDLPAGWQLAPQTDTDVYVFEGEGSNVIFQYMPATGQAKAPAELWQGVTDSGGQAAPMRSPMGIVKTKHCWAMLMGFTTDAFGSQLKDDVMKILGSAR